MCYVLKMLRWVVFKYFVYFFNFFGIGAKTLSYECFTTIFRNIISKHLFRVTTFSTNQTKLGKICNTKGIFSSQYINTESLVRFSLTGSSNSFSPTRPSAQLLQARGREEQEEVEVLSPFLHHLLNQLRMLLCLHHVRSFNFPTLKKK